jgi:hypothetical protein
MKVGKWATWVIKDLIDGFGAEVIWLGQITKITNGLEELRFVFNYLSFWVGCMIVPLLRRRVEWTNDVGLSATHIISAILWWLIHILGVDALVILIFINLLD